MTTEPESSSPPHSRSPHREIAERLIDQRSWVSRPAVSPNGQHVAFVVASTDLEHNVTRTRVWLDQAPLTGGDHDGDPTWSPDGRYLAFTSRRAAKQGDTTLHVLPIAAPGEMRTLCTMPDGITDPAWSPDGHQLAFTSRTRHERYAAKDSSWQPPRKVERFLSRLNGEDWILDRPSHVYVIAADGTQPTPRNLTPGEHQHSGVTWLADSTAVITTSARHHDYDRDLSTDLFVVPVRTSDAAAPALRRITGTDGEYHHAAVSPDGPRVAFIGVVDVRLYPQNAKVGVLPIGATDAPATSIQWVTGSVDRNFDCTTGDPTLVWRDDTTILALAEDRGEQHLCALAADGSREPEAVTSGAITVTGFDLAGGTIATTRTEVTLPAELYINDVRRTHVTAGYADALRGWERFSVPTADGTGEIDAWIMRPAGFDPERSYPVLLNVHGGPHTQYGEMFFDEAQIQAAAGFVVLMGNPRGSSGREETWAQAIIGPKHPIKAGSGWGTVDVDDVMAVLDGALAQFPFCDRERVGMLGGSYGGYMATWLAGVHSDRFGAICSERAVNNLESMEWSSDIATEFVAEHGVNHLDDPEEYRRRSPVRFVRDIETPMLLIHSEEDYRCPIVQAEELWIALRLLGKEVDFYRFPGENHELSRAGSPLHRVQRAEIILDWFADKLSAGTGP